jgi:hypothetical protein
MLVPSAALTLGSKLYEGQLMGLRLRRSRAPAMDRLEVSLPLAVAFEAEVGAECSLTLDGGDAEGGGGEAQVFAGQLTNVTRAGNALRITAHNGGLVLARYRPVGAYEQTGLDQVIASYCADAGIDVVLDIDAPILALYAADGHASALQEIARLAGLASANAAFDGEGRLHVTEDGGPEDELALRYGRELLQIEIGETLAPSDTITVVGEGAGDPGAPEARWLTTDFLAGSGPTPGIDAQRRRVPELRDSSDTEAAAVALATRRAAAARPVRMQTWLMPSLAPGMRLEVIDLPDPLGLEECHVTQVVSTIVAGGCAESSVWAQGRPAGGGLLGALGGLL